MILLLAEAAGSLFFQNKNKDVRIINLQKLVIFLSFFFLFKKTDSGFFAIYH
ncbi:hypothetical protein D920_03015 [Enterococcus faecalis 13-SD-W-01]|nr:hypothetical protein D920_03015 [Enterococcus faecalis 13-SD-W-01]